MQHLAHKDLVAAHLEDVLRSRPFASSPRLCEFLRYVVETELQGEGHTIKEFVIAAEVYRRDATYDPQVDSTVRVEASRLRAKLREYYRTEGALADVEIELPRGGYAPVFHLRAALQDVNEERGSAVETRRYAMASLVTAVLAGVVMWHAAGKVSSASPPPDAVELFVQADKLLRLPVHKNGFDGVVPASVQQSIATFERATRKAPKFARGWVGLAEAHEWAWELDKVHPAWRLQKAKAALAQALRVDPKLAEAYARLASIQFHAENDPVQAEATVRRALALNPHDVGSQARFVDLLRVTGRSDEALEVNWKAVQSEPASPRLWAQRAIVLYDLNRYEEALVAADHALTLPACDNNPRALWAKGMALERLGRSSEAEAVYRFGMTRAGDHWNLPSLGHLLGGWAGARKLRMCWRN